jgi:hypothetical protein
MEASRVALPSGIEPTATASDAAGVSTDGADNLRQDFHTVKLGINYHFGKGGIELAR